MEQIKDEPMTVEVFENDMIMWLQSFCEENNIDDMRKESQSVWNSALRYIYKHVFKNNDWLKSKELYSHENYTGKTNYNAYDYNKVMEILNIYIYDMCMKYNKEVSIIGFCTLTNIPESIVYEWGNSKGKLGELSETRTDIYKKLRDFREESLSNKLADGNKNPVGILAILNRHYQWNLPGVSKEPAKAALTAAELPKLQPPELSENNIQLPVIDAEKAVD